MQVSETALPDWLSDDFTAQCNRLRCTNKSDRARMVTALTRLAEHYGATIEAKPSALNQTHGVTVFIRRDPAYVMLDLNGDSSLHRGRYRQTGGVFLGHWNIERQSPAKFAGYFGTLAGSINQFHYCKATSSVEGFGGFIVNLAICLGAIMDGTAFAT